MPHLSKKEIKYMDEYLYVMFGSKSGEQHKITANDTDGLHICFYGPIARDVPSRFLDLVPSSTVDLTRAGQITLDKHALDSLMVEAKDCYKHKKLLKQIAPPSVLMDKDFWDDLKRLGVLSIKLDTHLFKPNTVSLFYANMPDQVFTREKATSTFSNLQNESTATLAYTEARLVNRLFNTLESKHWSKLDGEVLCVDWALKVFNPGQQLRANSNREDSGSSSSSYAAASGLMGGLRQSDANAQPRLPLILPLGLLLSMNQMNNHPNDSDDDLSATETTHSMLAALGLRHMFAYLESLDPVYLGPNNQIVAEPINPMEVIPSALRDYLNSFPTDEKEFFCATFERLGIECNEDTESYYCPITWRVPNKPVRFHGDTHHVFDGDTLIKNIKRNATGDYKIVHPCTQEEFSVDQIEPAIDSRLTIEALIAQAEQSRQPQQAEQTEHAAAPSL